MPNSVRRLFIGKGDPRFAVRLILSGLLVVAALFIIVMHPATPASPRVVITYTTATPSESKSEAVAYPWTGTNADPKIISIPAIGVDTHVQAMGVDQNGAVAAPTNIFLAGWFVKSVEPGQKGLSIIDGHLDGVKQPKGIFADLAKLQAGDAIVITRGDNSPLHYKIMTVQTVSNDQAQSMLFSQDPSVSSQLNLITCAGIYDKSSKDYQDRTIVTAVLQ